MARQRQTAFTATRERIAMARRHRNPAFAIQRQL
jgi:hypothetical protein